MPLTWKFHGRIFKSARYYEDTASQAPFRTDRQNSLAMKIFYVPLMRCDLSTVNSSLRNRREFYLYDPRSLVMTCDGLLTIRTVRNMAYTRRSQSNETEPKISRIQSNPIGRICCSISSVIEHNRTGTFWWVRLIELVSSISELNRTNRRDFIVSSILFGRKTKRIQLQLNRKYLPLLCMCSSLK